MLIFMECDGEKVINERDRDRMKRVGRMFCFGMYGSKEF